MIKVDTLSICDNININFQDLNFRKQIIQEPTGILLPIVVRILLYHSIVLGKKIDLVTVIGNEVLLKMFMFQVIYVRNKILMSQAKVNLQLIEIFVKQINKDWSDLLNDVIINKVLIYYLVHMLVVLYYFLCLIVENIYFVVIIVYVKELVSTEMVVVVSFEEISNVLHELHPVGILNLDINL